MDNDSFLIASQSVGACGLKIVSIVSKSVLLSGINAIKSIILVEWALSFGLSIIFFYYVITIYYQAYYDPNGSSKKLKTEIIILKTQPSTMMKLEF